jgi:hypothetical protein
MIGVGAMDSGVIDGRRWRRRMDGGSNKTLLNLEVRHGVGIASIFGEKRPILCVTEKKNTKKVGESQNRYGVRSNLGTNIYILSPLF